MGLILLLMDPRLLLRVLLLLLLRLILCSDERRMHQPVPGQGFVQTWAPQACMCKRVQGGLMRIRRVCSRSAIKSSGLRA